MSWENWNGDKLKKLTKSSMSDALYRAAEEVGAESDQQVPLDEGELQRSKYIKKNPSNSLEIAISYGGGEQTGYPRVPYAVKWHEVEADFRHGRKTNYLRDPIKQVGPKAVMTNLKKAGEDVW